MIPSDVLEFLERHADTVTTGAELSRRLSIPDRSARRYMSKFKNGHRKTVPIRQESTAFPASDTKEVRRVVALGDVHGDPDPQVLARVLEFSPDILVLGGDLFDHAAMSSHISDHYTPPSDDHLKEYRRVEQFLQTLCEQTHADIRIIRGNHDQWPVKSVMRNCPEWMLDYFVDPLDKLCQGLDPRVQMAGMEIKLHSPNGDKTTTTLKNPFLFVLDDVLFSHMNFTNSMTETGVSKLYRLWFMQWERSLGLQQVRMLVHFHVHQRTMLTVAGGHVLLIEPGMAGRADTEKYKYGYPAKWRPGLRGGLFFKQVKKRDCWVTDPDSVILIAPEMSLR